MADGRAIYYHPLLDYTITADATNDWWSLLGTSAVRIRLLGWEVTSNATSATLTSCTLRFITAAGTGGTAPNVEQPSDDDKTTAALASLRYNDVTTQAAGGGDIAGYQWEQLGPVGHIYTPEMAPIAGATDGFALTSGTAAGFEMSGFVCWEEIYV